MQNGFAMKPLGILATVVFMLAGLTIQAQPGSPQNALQAGKFMKEDGVTFLWTSNDGRVLDNYILPYSNHLTSRNGWEEITVIMWGPAVHELTEDQELQEDVAGLTSKGIEVRARKASVKRYDALDELKDMGVAVGNVDKELTADLRGDASHLIDL